MGKDPLDIIDAASQQFVRQVVTLPRRVERLERDVRLMRRGCLFLITGVGGYLIKTILPKWLG